MLNSCINLTWRRASHCHTGECVEVAAHDGEILVRDSTQPQCAVLRYSAEEWQLFISQVRSGQFS